MQNYSEQSKTYPQFLLKAKSEALGGNMCVAISGVYNGMAALAVTVFESTGKHCLDFFSVEVGELTLKEAIESGELITTLESIYMNLQMTRKTFISSDYAH